MKARLLVIVASLAAPLPAAARPPVASQFPAGFPVQFPARILAAHNAERAADGLAPLVWDNNLGIAAAAWAEHLALTATFDHSDRRSRPGIGENLWAGTRGAYSIEAMVHAWASEKRSFVRGIFPNVSRTGNWYDVSHYTQVIWPATTRIGCALASNARSDYLVCRYSPKGNVDGRPVP